MQALKKHPLLKGAFILTVTSFTTRFIGFFYRIFLSQTFGEEGVGIYQLVFPIFALGFSLTAAGIETAISRCVASKTSLGKKKEAKEILYTGMGISLILSFLVMLFLQKKATFIATTFLSEPRCSALLMILAYAFPFAAAHSCICGYYLGLKETKIPALSQLIEQLVRVLSVYLLFFLFTKNDHTVSIGIAVAGLVTGEIASSLFCIQSMHDESLPHASFSIKFGRYIFHAREILVLSLPLTGNRVLLNILQSIEAVSIPIRLQTYGLTVGKSLSIYGVLTGMALPCILFPSAITNSIATMLLPTIAEIQTLDNRKEMRSIIKKVSATCFLLGSLCCIFLLIFGRFVGQFLFRSELAGQFIITLAWMCPFLYTNSNFISIINGLGYTMFSFLFNACGLMIRISCVFVLVPQIGIQGYLWGLLASQLFTFLCCTLFLCIYLTRAKKSDPS